MTETRTVNLGLIGLGYIGKVHANAYRAIPLAFSKPAAVVRLCGLLRSKLTGDEALVDSLKPDLVTTDPEAFFNLNLDVVDICTPNVLHRQQFEAAAARGMHVYCEKPLAHTLEDARAMAALARQAGIRTQVAFVLRYLPGIRQMKALLASGALGDVLHFRARMFHASYLDPNRPMAWRLRLAESGGGAMADLGSHLLDMARYLMGDIGRVRASMRTFITERPGAAGREPVDVDDWMLAELEMKNGAVGQIEVTRVAAGASEDTQFEVYCRHGSLIFHVAQPEIVRFFDLKRKEWIQGLLGAPLPAGERPVEQTWPNAKMSQGMMTNAHLACVYDFLQDIAEGKDSMANFDEALAVQVALDACYRSARTGGGWVDIQE